MEHGFPKEAFQVKLRAYLLRDLLFFQSHQSAFSFRVYSVFHPWLRNFGCGSAALGHPWSALLICLEVNHGWISRMEEQAKVYVYEFQRCFCLKRERLLIS